MIYDELTTIDCKKWISIHVYIVKEYIRVPTLLTLDRITSEVGCDKLTRVMFNALQELEDLKNFLLWRRWSSNVS